MDINWMLVATIAGPIVGAAAGGVIVRSLERRARLITYFSHGSTFRVSRPEGDFLVFTSSIVVRNAGGQAARNVRIRHLTLPDYNIYPPVDHQVVALPDGSQEMLIPTLVPKEELTISYIYFPPTSINSLAQEVKSDEGIAQHQTFLLTRQFPMWLNRTLLGVLLVGVVAILYILVKLAMSVIDRL